MHDACRVVVALCNSDDVFQMLQAKGDVAAIRKHMRKADGSSLGVLADTLSQVPCWREAMDAFLSTTNAAEVHQQKMQELHAVLAKQSMRADPREAVSWVKELGFLQSELAASVFQSFLNDGLQYAKAYWKHAETLVKEDRWPFQQSDLQNFLCECTLVWPSEELFSAGVADLAKLAAAQSGVARVAEFLNSLEQMTKTLGDRTTWSASLEAVKKSTKQCQGLELNQLQKHKVQNCLHVVHVAASSELSKNEDAKIMIEVAECLDSWKADYQEKRLQSLHVSLRLWKAMAEWGTVAARTTQLAPGPDKEKLAELLRGKSGAEAYLASEEAGVWDKENIEQYDMKAGEVIAGVEKLLIDNAHSRLSDEVAKVSELLSRSNVGEKTWAEAVPASMSWGDVAKHAASSLAKVPAEELENEVKQLEEVPASCVTNERKDPKSKLCLLFVKLQRLFLCLWVQQKKKRVELGFALHQGDGGL